MIARTEFAADTESDDASASDTVSTSGTETETDTVSGTLGIVLLPTETDPDRDSPAPRVRLTTRHGSFVIRLHSTDAPLHAAAFLKLAESGDLSKFAFDEVVAEDIARCRSSEYTAGNERMEVAPENKRPHVRWSVGAERTPFSVARLRRSIVGRFYVCLRPAPERDGRFTVFGEVVDGHDVFTKLAGDDGAEVSQTPARIRSVDRLPAK